MNDQLTNQPGAQAPTLEVGGLTFPQLLQLSSMFAKSTIIPKDFQGNEGNCFVVLQLANRLGVDPFTMLQNVDVVYGRPGIRGSFARALVQSRTRGLEGDGFEVKGELPATFKNYDPAKSTFEVRYYVDKVNARTGEIERSFGPWIGPALAKEMGWWDKSGSFWSKAPSMCERMCKFRAVSWYVRDEDPNILAGIPLAEELQDYDAIDVTPERSATAAQKAFQSKLRASTSDEEASTEEVQALPLEEQKGITIEAAKALKEYAHMQGHKITEVIPALLEKQVEKLTDLTSEEVAKIEGWLQANGR